MKIGHRARLYPQPCHVRGLSRTFGATRFVFNQCINWRQWEYAHGYSGKEHRRSMIEMRSWLTSKNKQVYPWLTEVSSVALQEAVDQADKAYWAMVKKRSTKQRASLPRRRKHARQSFRLTKSGFKLKLINGRSWVYQLYIPKVGWIKVRSGRDLSSASSVTISRETTGHYYASFTLEAQPTLSASTQVAGIDVGLASYATIATPHGIEKIDNPRYYRTGFKKLKRAQRALSRAKKGSTNRTKARKRLARQHQHVANQRRDFIHKITTRLATDNQIVCLETIGYRSLVSTRLASSILDASWRTLTMQLDYKTQLHGGTTAYAPAYAPTTRTCSICATVHPKLGLDQRTWTCSTCGTRLDRDANAAINIIDAAGHGESINACGDEIRLELARAHVNETGTHRSTRRQGEGRNPLAVLTPTGRSRKPLP